MKRSYLSLFLCMVFSCLSYHAQSQCTSSGEIETNFGVSGKSSITGSGQYNSCSVQSDGKIVSVGYVFNSIITNKLLVTRSNANGSADNSFGDTGTFSISFGEDTFAFATSVAIKANGKIVVAGYIDMVNSSAFSVPGTANRSRTSVIIQLNADGELDSGFGTNGIFFPEFTVNPYYDYINSVELDNTDNILVGGTIYNSSGAYLLGFVSRINNNGTLDVTYGPSMSGGVITFGSSVREILNVYYDDISGSSKVYATGYSEAGGSSQTDIFVAVLFTPTGLFYTGFDTDGMAFYNFSGTFHYNKAYTIKLQSDGKILLGGSLSTNGSNSNAIVARLYSDGIVDTGFDTDGVLTVFAGVTNDQVRDIVVLVTGNILVTGIADFYGSAPYTFTARVASGVLDTSFDGDGVFLNNYILGGYGTYLHTDGRLVAVGYDASGYPTQIKIRLKCLPEITYGNQVKTYGDASFFHAATSTSPGTISHNVISGGSYASVNALSGEVSIQGAGVVTVVAVQNETGTYYAITDTSTITINKAVLTVTAGNGTRAYGENNPSFSVTYSGFKNGDQATSLDVPPTASSNTTTSSNAGSYPVFASDGEDDNYTFNYVDGTLNITKVALDVVADDKSREEGTLNPVLTYSFVGLVNGETESVISGSADITCSADLSSAPGNYPIVISAGTLFSNNYTFDNFTNGTLTVVASSTTSVQNSIENKIKIYPIPSEDGTFTIETPDKIQEIIITNQSGQQEYFNTTSFRTDFKGLLFMKVKTVRGEYVRKVEVR